MHRFLAFAFVVSATTLAASSRAADAPASGGVGDEIHSLGIGSTAALKVERDFRFASHAGVGPYAAVSLDPFSSCTSDAGDCALGAKSLHAWLLGGVREVFDV